MSNVEQINPFLLPFVEFGEKDKLPQVSGIYFVLLDTDILYIGKSINLQQRWLAHHRANQLKSQGKVILAWLTLDGEELEVVEEACIEYFKPLLNGTIIPDGFGGKKSSLRLPDEILAGMKRLAREHGRSLHSEVIQARHAWMKAHEVERKEKHMVYHFSYEVGSDAKGIVPGEIAVEGVSESRAREFAEQVLEEQFPGDEGHSLLELSLEGVQEQK